MFEHGKPCLERKYKSTSFLLRPAKFNYEPSSHVHCDVTKIFSNCSTFKLDKSGSRITQPNFCASQNQNSFNLTHGISRIKSNENSSTPTIIEVSIGSHVSPKITRSFNGTELKNRKEIKPLFLGGQDDNVFNSNTHLEVQNTVPPASVTPQNKVKRQSLPASIDLTASNTMDEHIRIYLKCEKLDQHKLDVPKKLIEETLQFNIKQKQAFLERKKNIELDILSDQLNTYNFEDTDLQQHKAVMDKNTNTRHAILNTLEEMNKKMTEVKLKQKQIEEQIQKQKHELLMAQCKQVQEYVHAFKRHEEIFARDIETCQNLVKFKQDGKMYMEFNGKVCSELTNLVYKCKQMTITQDDLVNLSTLMNKSEECFVKLRQLYDSIQAEVAQQAKLVEQASSSPLQRTNDQSIHVTCANIITASSLKYYKNTQSRYTEVEALLESIMGDTSLKSFRFQCQKTFNTPINAINAVDRAHLLDKYNRLAALLRGDKVIANGRNVVSASDHPQGILFCQYMMAKKFVSQVDLKPEVLFAYASVIVSLWQDFPDFGCLLLAEFHKQCPYLIPAFWPQLEGQSIEDYYKLLGYLYKDGNVEKQDLFLKRMSGIIQLYAAITVTFPRSCNKTNQPHPHNIKYAWRWLAEMLNLEPQPDVCATLMFHFIKITGNALSLTYKKQFFKLIRLIQTHYLPRIKQVTPEDQSQQSISTLGDFVDQIIKSGCVAPHVGQLSPNFW